MERWVCVQGSLEVWDGARGKKKRDVELSGNKILNMILVFHIIMMMCICQV